jgi:ACS family tartrate transporter-like MFS transporter
MMSAGDHIFSKCARRLLPLVTAAFIVNFLDRTNVGFAALTMNRDLGFSPSVYGLGAGIFFLSYSIFQVPANLMLHRFGARRWIAAILIAWGAAASVTAAIHGPASYYIVRFLLGMAEAGFFPGIILYLTFWFPKAWLGRATAWFMCGNAASFVIGGPLASFILTLNGLAGLRGWQWLFLLEGVPACIIGVAVLRWIPDGPADAHWLSQDEAQIIAVRVGAEKAGKQEHLLPALFDARVLLLGTAYGGILFAIYGFSFWLPLLIQGIGFSNSATGFVTALLYIAGLPVMILWARSSDRHDERFWHVALAALLAAAALLCAAVAPHPVLLLVSIAAAAVGMYSVLSPFYGVASSFLSGRAMAGGFALINMLGGLIGGFAGQSAIGLLRELSGGYGSALAAMAAALAIAAAIVIGLRQSASPAYKPSFPAL